MVNRFHKAISSLFFDITNDILDIVSAMVFSLVYVQKRILSSIESFLLSYRSNRGFRVDQYEPRMEDWQYLRMAEQLKLTVWERDRLDRLGETVVMNSENFPNLSRRQARKVLETYKILRKTSANRPRRVR